MKTHTLAILALVLLSFGSPMQAQWSPTKGPFGTYSSHVKCLVVSPASGGTGGTNLYAGTGQGVFLSTNNATSWTQAGLTNTDVLSLAVSGTNLFAGTYSGLFRSTDDGTRWTAASMGLTTPDVRAIAISANGTGGTNLIAGNYGPAYLFPQTTARAGLR